MKKTLSLAASGVVAAGSLLFAAPGTAQAGNCTPVDGGGYDHYICGKVFNESDLRVAVSKDGPSNYWKWVWPGDYAGSDGYGEPGVDVDGFLIEWGCTMTWNDNSWPRASKYGTGPDGLGEWWKISDTSSVTITSYTC